MNYVFDQLREQASAALVATGLIAPEQIALAEPKNRELADLACPVFIAAKAAGDAPPVFAQKLAAAVRLSDNSLLASVEAAGGFVNFTVNPQVLAAAVLDEVTRLGDAFGKDHSVGAGEKVIVEYSSPNIARKMHVGHLRSTVIGHSLRLIFEALGYDVIADNHLGDWGTQFGMLLAAIDLWKLTPWNSPDPVQSLVDIYAQFNNALVLEERVAAQVEWKPAKETKTDNYTSENKLWVASDAMVRAMKCGEKATLRNLAREWFKKLEDGDVWARETWQRLIDITMAEFSGTYERLGVSFTTQHGESYFESMMPEVMAEAVEKGVAVRDAGGALVVEFDDKLPSCLLQKSDGGTLYQTRDAATCLYRLKNYAPARNVYVVGAEQKLHFQQVFEIVRRMGYPKIADVSIHISFGKVSPPNGGRFSMREGNVVFLNDVLDEAVERAVAKMRENVTEGRSEISEAEIGEIAETLGVGAVIYADLFQGPDRNITFDWDKMLADTGNTAMYLQYAHARCKSILRKANTPFAKP
ncbi:arginine--tRNA ligase [Armatimonas sp.]|uniref:arginine--tRNA ligase n=1 Tax=Armatimonas sp. TaxID=1872638 RepID=UPI00286CAB59|nr:arginine--tRNA ligase [Armatimonas sp.]